jgi:hypothetical protein
LEAHRGYLRVDDDYVRVLTLKELPSETRPLLLQGPLDIAANFHVVTEWHPVDNAKSRREIASRRRHNHNSKTSFVSNLQDQQNTAPKDQLVDDSKEAAVSELGGALTALGMESKNFGEFTLSIVIYDEDRLKVEHTVADFQKLFTQHDGLLYEERYNLLNAFFATIPGNRQFNLRKQWALNSNYADLSFLCWKPAAMQCNVLVANCPFPTMAPPEPTTSAPARDEVSRSITRGVAKSRREHARSSTGAEKRARRSFARVKSVVPDSIERVSKPLCLHAMRSSSMGRIMEIAYCRFTGGAWNSILSALYSALSEELIG